jgi:hypothetical protein
MIITGTWVHQTSSNYTETNARESFSCVAGTLLYVSYKHRQLFSALHAAKYFTLAKTRGKLKSGQTEIFSYDDSNGLSEVFAVQSLRKGPAVPAIGCIPANKNSWITSFSAVS